MKLKKEHAEHVEKAFDKVLIDLTVHSAELEGAAQLCLQDTASCISAVQDSNETLFELHAQHLQLTKDSLALSTKVVAHLDEKQQREQILVIFTDWVVDFLDNISSEVAEACSTEFTSWDKVAKSWRAEQRAVRGANNARRILASTPITDGLRTVLAAHTMTIDDLTAVLAMRHERNCTYHCEQAMTSEEALEKLRSLSFPVDMQHLKPRLQKVVEVVAEAQAS